jgi:hypothetical protein
LLRLIIALKEEKKEEEEREKEVGSFKLRFIKCEGRMAADETNVFFLLALVVLVRRLRARFARCLLLLRDVCRCFSRFQFQKRIFLYLGFR